MSQFVTGGRFSRCPRFLLVRKGTRMIIATKADELSANQQRALQALLATTSIAAAAEEAGLNARTIKRYLAEPTFAQVYREQREIALQETVSALQSGGVAAVTALREALDTDDDNLRLRAARAVLDYLFKGVELERRVRETEDLIARIDALEAGSGAWGGNGWHH